MNTKSERGPQERVRLHYVRPGEAIERLSLLTGEPQSTIEGRHYKYRAYPTRIDEETGEKLVGIPADAPPTREVQLAQVRAELQAVKGERVSDRRKVFGLERELLSANSTIADYAGRFEDEVSYRGYLTDNLRTQGEERAGMRAHIEYLARALRGRVRVIVFISLTVGLVTACVTLAAAWLILR